MNREPLTVNQSVAFFDVDGTLLLPPSMERRFLRWLITRRLIGPRHLLRSALSIMTDFPWSMAKFKANKSYLRGESLDRFRSLGEECVAAVIVPALRRSGRETIEQHRNQHDRIILLTGSLDLLAQPLARSLGIEECIAGRLEQVEGRLTGRTISPHPYGEGKAMALRAYARKTGLDLRDAILYSDSFSDAGSFALVGRGVVVNPRPQMARLARERGWAIVRW